MRYTFTWDELVTDALVAELCGLEGADVVAVGAGVVAGVAPILREVGGLPVVDSALTAAELTDMGRRLLVEAVGHFLAEAGLTTVELGHVLVPSNNADLDSELVARRRVELNRATAAELDSLPGVGPSRAAAIVQERSANGWYASLEELVERVDGVGEAALTDLRHSTSFAPPWAEARSPHEGPGLGPPMRAALERFAGVADPGQRLLDAIRAVHQTVSREPHPATARRRVRVARPAPALHEVDAQTVGVLDGPAYYERLPGILRSATTSILVALFHAAMPGPSHPTRVLLDELVAAHARGVAVRVLLDADRPTDPYMSTIINADAKAYLLGRGVDCRLDAVEQLLHSKFVVVDDSHVVIGSHNWSAGSYFRFDDLSLLVRSAELAGELTTRFETLWPP